jgi:hypothetical protein
MLKMALKLMVLQPELLLTHVRNYSNFLIAEGSKALAAWRIQMILYVASVMLFIFGAFSATTSLLLWAAFPALNQSTGWLLAAIPIFFIVGSGAFLLMARRYSCQQFIQNVQQQIQLDKELLFHADKGHPG